MSGTPFTRGGWSDRIARAAWVPGVVLITFVLSACAGGDEKSASPPPGCGFVSGKTLSSLFPATTFRGSGGLGTAEERRQAGARCQVSDKDTGELLLQLTVIDASSTSDLSALRTRVTKEASTIQGCDRVVRLAGGYLCEAGTAASAAVVRGEHLIRVRVPGERGGRLTEARLSPLLQQVQQRVDAAGRGSS